MTANPTNGTGASTTNGLDRLLPVSRVCEILAVSDRSLRRWVHLGLIPPPDVRIGRNLRWRESTIRAVVNGEMETRR
ncbi:MAG: helix-turn-helix domain-containing protein [Planctomycetota bacterium]